MKYSYYAIKNITTDSIVKDKTYMPWLFTESEEDIVNMLVNHYNSMGRDLHCNEGKFKKIVVDIVEREPELEIEKIEDEDNNNELLLNNINTSSYEKVTVEEPFSYNPCQNCSNNPKNGGSGICNCTLGLPKMSWQN